MAFPADVPVRQKVAGNAMLALGTSVWATHFLVTDELLQSWDPYFVTAARLLAGTLFLTIFYLAATRGRALRRLPWRPALLLGTAGIAFSTVLLTLGVKHAGPVPAAIVAAGAPIVAAFVARVGFGLPLTAAIVAGAVVAAAGGTLAALGPGEGEAGDLRGGELLILLSVTVFAWYSIGAQRWMSGHLSQFGITAVTIAIDGAAMAVALPLLMLAGIAEARFSLDGASLAYILYLGAGPASFSLFAWHWGVSRIGVTVASIYSNLVPVVVVAIRAVEGEAPSESHLAGGALIVAGVLIAQLLPAGRRPAARKGGRA